MEMIWERFENSFMHCQFDGLIWVMSKFCYALYMDSANTWVADLASLQGSNFLLSVINVYYTVR